MNANKMIESSQINQIGIKDADKSLDGSKTFADIKAGIVQAIGTINDALPKMKAAGVDMNKAAGDAEGLFRNIVRREWGSSEVDFYINRDGGKAITAVTPRHLDGIVEQISAHIKTY